MHRQLVQMSTLVAACASPLHSASCAVDKSINRWAYASVYVYIRPYVEQRVSPRWPWSAFVIGWNSWAGLRWPWKFIMFELWWRQLAYARNCAGRNWWQKYKQLHRQSAYARTYVRMKYKTGFVGCVLWIFWRELTKLWESNIVIYFSWLTYSSITRHDIWHSYNKRNNFLLGGPLWGESIGGIPLTNGQ